jgi:hypothetical protein
MPNVSYESGEAVKQEKRRKIGLQRTDSAEGTRQTPDVVKNDWRNVRLTATALMRQVQYVSTNVTVIVRYKLRWQLTTADHSSRTRHCTKTAKSIKYTTTFDHKKYTSLQRLQSFIAYTIVGNKYGIKNLLDILHIQTSTESNPALFCWIHVSLTNQ